MNSTPRPVLYIIVVSIAFLATIGLLALCGTLFYKNYADPSVLSSLIAIEGGLVGSLSTLLSNMRQPLPANGSPPPPPTPVKIEQPETEPVPVVEKPPVPATEKPPLK